MKMLSSNPGKGYNGQHLLEVAQKTELELVEAMAVALRVFDLAKATSEAGTTQHGDVEYANEESTEVTINK